MKLTATSLRYVQLRFDFKKVCPGHVHFASLLQDADENKLFYTDIFHDYQQVVEGSLEQRLSAAIPNFSMDTFITVGNCAITCVS